MKADEEEEPKKVEKPDQTEEGTGRKYDTYHQEHIVSRPLNWDEIMEAANHEGCDKDDSYPDLSLTLPQRNKLKEDRLRAERQAGKGK